MKHRAGQRGLTLIELLLALSLLGLLMVGIGSWLRISADAAVAINEELRFNAAADALLARIHEDLLRGDFDEETGKAVTADGNSLRIRTRDVRKDEITLVRQYRFEPENERIRLDDVTLLGDVRSATFSISDDGRALLVRLESLTGEARQREFEL